MITKDGIKKINEDEFEIKKGYEKLYKTNYRDMTKIVEIFLKKIKMSLN